MRIWRGLFNGLALAIVLWAAMFLMVCGRADAAVSVYAGHFLADNANTATTTQNVSGLGFNPKACIFFWNSRPESTDTVDGTLAQFYTGWGFATDTEEVATYSRDVDAAAANTYDGGWRSSTTSGTAGAIMIEVDNAGTPAETGRVGLNDMDTPANDGFQVIYDDQLVSDHRVMFWCIGGTDITNVDIGTDTAPTTTPPVSKSVTGLGFQPEVLFLLQCSHTTAAPVSPTGDRSCNLGMATGSSNEGVVATGADDGTAAIEHGSYAISSNTAAVLSTTAANTTVTSRAEFTQFTSGGFDLNYLEVLTTGERFFYLVIRGGSWRVDNLTTSVTGSATIAESGFGFQPRGALFVSAARAESASDTATNHLERAVGAFDASREVAMTSWSEHAPASGVVEAATAVEFDEVYLNISTGDAIEGRMGLSTIDSDGFTMIMDTGDATANWVLYVAVGDEPAATSRRVMVIH